MRKAEPATKQWRMTYSKKGVTGCSARVIALRETKKALELLAETLKMRICNVIIKAVE
jgi:hypothetical protein